MIHNEHILFEFNFGKYFIPLCFYCAPEDQDSFGNYWNKSEALLLVDEYISSWNFDKKADYSGFRSHLVFSGRNSNGIFGPTASAKGGLISERFSL